LFVCCFVSLPSSLRIFRRLTTSIGALATGLNWVGIIIGAYVAFVGVINIVLACFYKNALKKKVKFGEGPPEGMGHRQGYEQS
jgi:hypothetical protein